MLDGWLPPMGRPALDVRRAVAGKPSQRLERATISRADNEVVGDQCRACRDGHMAHVPPSARSHPSSAANALRI